MSGNGSRRGFNGTDRDVWMTPNGSNKRPNGTDKDACKIAVVGCAGVGKTGKTIKIIH